MIAESKVLKTDDLTQANVPIPFCSRDDLDIPSLSVVDTQYKTDPGTTDSESCGENEIEYLSL